MKQERKEKRFMSSSSLVVVLIVMMLLQYSTSTETQEVEDEREFDYIEGSEKGPHRWGELKEEWAACKDGNMQSPIDLWSWRVKVIPKSRRLRIKYKSFNATLTNRGHDIALFWELGEAGSIRLNGIKYFLQHCHCHSPSQHSITSTKYEMELHMVHVSPDPRGNKILVLAAFFKIGHPDPFLAKLEEDINEMAKEEGERVIGMIDPSKIQLGGKMYYTYIGSLTTPPCTQGVI